MVQLDLGDVRLDRTDGEPPEPRRRGPSLWFAAISALLLVVALGWWWFVRRPASQAVKVRTDLANVAAPKAAPRPTAEAGDNIALPPLDESDALVRDLVGQLSTHPRIAAWLTTDQLIRNFATVVSNVADGHTPVKHLRTVRPSGAFKAREAGSRLLIDPRSYERYNGHAAAFASLDAQGAARLYATLKPRIEEAYKELGAPDGTFDRALQRAIVELLKTPIVEGDVVLQSKSVSYEFASPALESLSTAQRQLLRMGPSNVRLVKAKLREIAPHLGIPEDALPPPDDR
jgi:Protein of unknown function (DUF3014)